MGTRSRIQRVAKWAGVVVCAILIAVFVFSVSPTRRVVNYRMARASSFLEGELSRGVVAAAYFDRGVPGMPSGWSVSPAAADSGGPWWRRAGFIFPSYARIPVRRGDVKLFWWDKTPPGGPVIFTMYQFWLPLWIPILIAVALTSGLWYLDRVPPGHCRRCGMT